MDCIICGVELDANNHHQSQVNNYIYKCNECLRREKREWARDNVDKKLSNDRSTRYKLKLKSSNPIKYSCSQMRSSARKRATRLNLPFELSAGYLSSIAPATCPVFGEEIRYGGGDKSKWSASLDRIVPSLGYVEGNVQIISNLANMMKNQASKKEILMFAQWAMEKFGNKTK